MDLNSYPHPIIKRLRSEYPALLPTIVTIIRRAYDEVNTMLTPARRGDQLWQEAYPHMLYASMQSLFAEAFNEDALPGVTGTLMPNTNANCHHVEIKLSGIVLTVNALSNGETRPRNAVYRENLAGQISIFDDLPRSNEDGRLYVSIVHKRDTRGYEPKEIKLVSMCHLGVMGALNHSILNEVMPEETIISQKVSAIAEPEIIAEGNGLRLK